MRKKSGLFALVFTGMILILTTPVFAASIDFEGLPAGLIVEELSTGAGITGSIPGKVTVFGRNALFGGANVAIIFDSACPGVPFHCTGGDYDLGTPNQDFGGPGIGSGGEAGSPFQNDTPQGKTLILAEDLVDANNNGLVDDPDDADVRGFVNFDFSTVNSGHGKKPGTVTVNSVTIMDIELEQGEQPALVELSGPQILTSTFAINATGNNGIVTFGGIGLSGVSNMRINVKGSSAVASVIFQEDQPGLCWITTGGFLNAGLTSGSKDFTFGGNVGPPPSGSWQVIDHNTGDNFHSNDVHIVECIEIPGTGPGQPGGKKGLTVNQAFFEGTGRLNGVPGYPFEGYVIDRGEPSGKQGNDTDEFSITVYHPITSAIVFQASGPLDGGNVQIHPPKP